MNHTVPPRERTGLLAGLLAFIGIAALTALVFWAGGLGS